MPVEAGGNFQADPESHKSTATKPYERENDRKLNQLEVTAKIKLKDAVQSDEYPQHGHETTRKYQREKRRRSKPNQE
jgi:hypothetical protein